LGDWWAYGYHKYGERKAKTAAKKLRYEFTTLMNIGSVARRIETSLRREDLTFSHHVEVAKLDPADQKYWLNQAVRCRWSVAALRQHIYKREFEDSENYPHETAIKWAADLSAQAERARQINPLAIRNYDDPRLDWLSEGEIAGLIGEMK